MASQTAAADEAQTQTEKDVTVLAYGTNPDADERALAADVDPDGRDFYEQRTSTNTKHYIKYTDDDGEERTEWIRESAYVALVGSPEERDPSSDATIVEETEQKVRYERSPIAAARALASKLFGNLPEELPHGLEKGTFGRKWQNELSETKVHIDDARTTSQRVLVHQSERNGGEDNYETEEEYPALKFKLNFSGTEEEVSDWSEELVPEILKQLSDVDGVGKVRITDCKTRVEREGDCYNL